MGRLRIGMHSPPLSNRRKSHEKNSHRGDRAVLAAGTLASAVAADKLKVGFIYLGPVGDFGWTYQHDVARQEMDKEFGDKVETTYPRECQRRPGLPSARSSSSPAPATS